MTSSTDRRREDDFVLSLDDGAAPIERSAGPAVHRSLAAQLAAIQTLFRREEDAPAAELRLHLRAWSRSHLEEGDIAQVVALAERARREFDALVTIGIGGSDLSARVYHDVLNDPYQNLLPSGERGGAPEVYFTGDTFDPQRLRGLLDMLEGRNLLGRTLFNVISKSGRTGETIASLLIIRDRLQSRAEGGDRGAWRRQVVATTGIESSSALCQLHRSEPFYGETLLPVPEGVGGRFSAFSPVGLFFLAMTAGKGETPSGRVRQALDGVREAEALFRLPWEDRANAAYAMARWLHLAETWGRKGTLVFYNYADNRSLGDWFVQLYEESVQERGTGLNIISAVGPTSNHSILNGILNGPRDKVIWFIHWRDLGRDLMIPTGTGIGGELEAFEGLSLNQVQTASYRGTQEDLTANGVPNATLSIPKRDVKNLAKFMRMLMDLVAVKGRLQGLHIDEAGAVDLGRELTYLQTAVDGYKERTRRIAAEMKKKN